MTPDLLNDLERRIATRERRIDNAEKRIDNAERVVRRLSPEVERLRWAQAREVARRKDAGETLRAIAKSWNNHRTGKPYRAEHAGRVTMVWKRFGTCRPRPGWREAYVAARFAPGIEPSVAMARLAASRRNADIRHNERKRLRRNASKPSNLIAWATRALVAQIEAGRVEALWEIDEALEALIEVVEEARLRSGLVSVVAA